MDIVTALLVFAEGRGQNTSEVGGILIIVGIVLGVAVLGFVGHYVVNRVYMKNRKRDDVFQRKPHKRGRIGRIR